MTLPREVVPGRDYMITRRCSERRFFVSRPRPREVSRADGTVELEWACGGIRMSPSEFRTVPADKTTLGQGSDRASSLAPSASRDRGQRRVRRPRKDPCAEHAMVAKRPVAGVHSRAELAGFAGHVASWEGMETPLRVSINNR
jgi:hypothetical protein